MRSAELYRPHSVLITPRFFDVALWLPLLFLAVSVPMLALTRNAVSGDIGGEVSIVYGAVIYAIMGMLSILVLRHRYPMKKFFSATDLPLLLYLTFLILQAVGFQSVSIAIQTGVLICAIIAIRAACFSARIRNGLFLSSIGLAMFIVAAYLLLGPPQSRWLGGIHPNVFGAVCVGAFSLSLFGPAWWRDTILVLVLAVSVAISSRYTMVTTTLIYALFSLMNWHAIGRVRIAIVILIAVVAVLSLLLDPENSPIASALELSDSTRGLGSGISGRGQHWSYFLPQFLEEPIAGYGFRSRGSYFGPHNGFLDIILQVGLIGSFLFFAFYALRLKSLIHEALSTPALTERGKLLSIMIGVSVGAQLQPQFFSFGDPFGILAMICLFSIPGLERSGVLASSRVRQPAGNEQNREISPLSHKVRS